MEIRPMLADDVEAVLGVANDALWGDGPGEGWWRRARTEHLLATDPDGAWVAVIDGEVAGVAMALVRERVWGLSLLVVAERARGRGAGRALVQATLETLDRAEAAMVLSAEHPAALRLYATSGFALRPCVSAAGDVRFRPARPEAVREASDADLGWMDDLAREVRGGPYSAELPLWQARDAHLLCVDGRGWMAGLEGRVLCLFAADEQAATWLLEAHLSMSPSAAVDFISAGHDWAVQTCLAAGLALSPDGPMFIRGRPGTLAPYLPSGAFL